MATTHKCFFLPLDGIKGAKLNFKKYSFLTFYFT